MLRNNETCFPITPLSPEPSDPGQLIDELQQKLRQQQQQISRLQKQNLMLESLTTNLDSLRPSQKYPLIQKYSEQMTVKELCRYLKVSRSGYYYWLGHSGERSQRDRIEKTVGGLIQECQRKSNKTYGYRRVCGWLRREYGVRLGQKKVLRLMNKYGLLSETRRQRPAYQKHQPENRFENILSRNFRTTAPNQKWCTDITCIHTKKGVLYLSVVKDLYDNFIVAFETGTSQDNALVLRTLKKARREMSQGLVLHSDQGFPYTSQEYLQYTSEFQLVPSMSEPGSPLDNACAETFFGTLKSECLYRRHPQTLSEARTIIEKYIYFYNYQRVQGKGKNMMTPFEKRSQFQQLSLSDLPKPV